MAACSGTAVPPTSSASAPTVVFPLPDALSFEQGAAIPMNYLTAHFALAERGGLREGETVLVHGAAGGVGTATLQVAKGYGARTIAVVSSDEKAEMARRAGADEVVAVDGFRDAVTELTDGQGVDVVMDVVGGDLMTDSLRSLATQGRVLVVGFTAGAIPEVKVNRLLLNNVDVRGVGWGAYAMVRPGYMRKQWDELLPLMESGVIDAADRRDVPARGVRPGAAGHGRPPDPRQVGRHPALNLGRLSPPAPTRSWWLRRRTEQVGHLEGALAWSEERLPVRVAHDREGAALHRPVEGLGDDAAADAGEPATVELGLAQHVEPQGVRVATSLRSAGASWSSTAPPLPLRIWPLVSAFTATPLLFRNVTICCPLASLTCGRG